MKTKKKPDVEPTGVLGITTEQPLQPDTFKYDIGDQIWSHLREGQPTQPTLWRITDRIDNNGPRILPAFKGFIYEVVNEHNETDRFYEEKCFNTKEEADAAWLCALQEECTRREKWLAEYEQLVADRRKDLELWQHKLDAARKSLSTSIDFGVSEEYTLWPRNEQVEKHKSSDPDMNDPNVFYFC